MTREQPMTREQFEKLPRYAQEHIKTLTRERDMAVRHLTDFRDEQTPGPVSYTELVCDGGEEDAEGRKKPGPRAVTKYLQTTRVEINTGKVRLEITIKPWNKDDHSIYLQWHDDRSLSSEVAMVPTAYQSCTLKPKDQQR